MVEEKEEVSQDFEQDEGEGIKTWNYKTILFYSLNNYQRAATQITTSENYPAKINNLYLAINSLWVLFSPAVSKTEGAISRGEAVYVDYLTKETELNRKAQFATNELNAMAYQNALLLNRQHYIRATYQIIIDSLQAQGQLLRKEVGIIAGSNRKLNIKQTKTKH
jgi:hypothetical protein